MCLFNIVLGTLYFLFTDFLLKQPSWLVLDLTLLQDKGDKQVAWIGLGHLSTLGSPEPTSCEDVCSVVKLSTLGAAVQGVSTVLQCQWGCYSY
jgi:hypothetical protein